MKEESNQLYFELRNEYDNEASVLKGQKEYLKQLQEFAKAILTIEDKSIEKNFVFTVQKRNKAPLYSNVEQLLSDVERRLEELEQKQRGMDRLSIVKGIEKYEDALKGHNSSSRKSSMKSLGQQNFGASPANL